MSLTVTVTPYTDANPAPRAEVLVENIPTGTISITRLADGRTMPVRGAVSLPSSTGVSVIDSEIPFGVPVTYQVQSFDPSGASLGFTTSAPVQLDVSTVWVHQPLEPRLAAEVELSDDSATEIARSTSGELVYADGASVGTWIGGRRRGIEGLDLSIDPGSIDGANMLQRMLGGYEDQQTAVLCIRTPPAFVRLPRTLFITVPKAIDADVNVRYGGTLTLLQFTGDETRPPTPGLVLPLLRYEDTDTFFGTYSAIDTYYGSYLARDRDYSKAGFAG